MHDRSGFIRMALMTLLLVLIAGTAFAQEQVAIIHKINGKLEFRKNASDNWAAAKPMMALANGNQLRTGTGDKAMVYYTSTGTRVLVNENTVIEIQAEIADPGTKPQKERTKLLMGEIYNHARGKYEVETPSSVASVRGTQFNALSSDGGDTFVGVEGVIDIMNSFGAVVLNQYQMTQVPRGQAPQDPTNLSQNQVDQLTGWTAGVEPTWKLNLVPEGGANQTPNGVFTLTVFAMKGGSADQEASFALSSLTSDSPSLEFSTDGGKTWSSAAPQLTLVNGQAATTCRMTQEGVANLTASAPDAETALLSLTTQAPKQKKTLELKFTNPDGGGEQTLIWELEEK